MNKQELSLTQEVQSSSEGPHEKHVKRLLVCVAFPILNLCHEIFHSQPPQISKMKRFAKIVND